MGQMAPVDISEVVRLRERVKLCHAADVPEAAESKVSSSRLCRRDCIFPGVLAKPSKKNLFAFTKKERTIYLALRTKQEKTD